MSWEYSKLVMNYSNLKFDINEKYKKFFLFIFFF